MWSASAIFCPPRLAHRTTMVYHRYGYLRRFLLPKEGLSIERKACEVSDGLRGYVEKAHATEGTLFNSIDDKIDADHVPGRLHFNWMQLKNTVGQLHMLLLPLHVDLPVVDPQLTALVVWRPSDSPSSTIQGTHVRHGKVNNGRRFFTCVFPTLSPADGIWTKQAVYVTEDVLLYCNSVLQLFQWRLPRQRIAADKSTYVNAQIAESTSLEKLRAHQIL